MWFVSILFAVCSFGNSITQTIADKYVKNIFNNTIDELSLDFNESLQLTTPQKQGVYSNNQVKMILTEYLNTNKPNSCSLQSYGKSENGANYVNISVNANTFKYVVSIYFRMHGEKSSIHEIKILL